MGENSSYSYSRIITIDHGYHDNVRLFPNPVNGDEVKLMIYSSVAQSVNIDIHDISGKIIQTKTVDVQIGENIQNLVLSEFSSGSYMLTVTEELAGNKSVLRLLKY